MKITKAPIEAELDRKTYERAHDGCYKCPLCKGAEMAMLEIKYACEDDSGFTYRQFSNKYGRFLYTNGTLFRLNEAGEIKERVKNMTFIENRAPVFIEKKHIRYKIDRYRCSLCGAEWESDPFDERLDVYYGRRS